MSHAMAVEDSESGDLIQFQFNSDLSGDVEVSRTTKTGSFVAINIPGHALLRFVASYVANERIAELEEADWKAVFGIKGR